MAISVGQSRIDAANANSVTSTGINTAASGSSFLIWSVYDGTFSSVADNKGNSYTEILGETSPTSFFGNLKTRLHLCINGTGGSGHTATLDGTASDARSVCLIEITGGALASLLDVITTPAEDLSSPFDTPSSGTLAQADELVLAFYLANTGGGTEAFTWANSFASLQEVTNASLYYCCAVGSRVVSATTALTGRVTLGTGTQVLAFLASFKAAAAGSSTTVTPAQAALTVNGRTPTTSAFTNVRIRDVLVNASGQAVGSATDIGLRVWYSGICAGAPDVSLNGMTTDANGTASWSIPTGSLAFNQPIFMVAQNSVSYSHYTCGRLVPNYE